MRLDEQRRGLMLVLLGQGRSCHSIARELGGSPSTVRKVAVEAGMVLSRGRVGGVGGLNEHRYSPRRRRRRLRENPVLEVGEPAQWRDGQGRLTLAGRILIEVRVGDRVPLSRIAAELGVHRSTVSREVKRCPGRYRAQPAQRLADWSRRRPKDRKLVLGTPLWDEVVTRLNNKHSPQQIAHRLRQDFPEDPTMWVSHETIYQALYVQAAGGLRHELTVEKALRSGRSTRGPRSRLSGRGIRSWIGEATITNRPAEVEDRAVPGHWEGDLIIGRGGTSALVTLNERTTRYTMIQRVTSRDSTTVTDALIQMAHRLPATLMTTLTWDQGIEMAQHARFTFASGCQAYFCDPHSPWQRPTNENSNGLIRDFFPKGTDFTHITDTQVQHAEDLLNTRPRRVLDWATPAEKIEQLLNVAHTT